MKAFVVDMVLVKHRTMGTTLVSSVGCANYPSLKAWGGVYCA